MRYAARPVLRGNHLVGTSRGMKLSRAVLCHQRISSVGVRVQQPKERQLTDTTEDLNLIWGAKDIGLALNLTERQAFHALEKGHVPGARKMCGRWCVSKHKLREAFGLSEAA